MPRGEDAAGAAAQGAGVAGTYGFRRTKNAVRPGRVRPVFMRYSGHWKARQAITALRGLRELAGRKTQHPPRALRAMRPRGMEGKGRRAILFARVPQRQPRGGRASKALQELRLRVSLQAIRLVERACVLLWPVSSQCVGAERSADMSGVRQAIPALEGWPQQESFLLASMLVRLPN